MLENKGKKLAKHNSTALNLFHALLHTTLADLKKRKKKNFSLN